MAKTDTIHMRVSPEVKSEADSILSLLGITTADAINIFLNQVILRGGLPFEVRLPTARAETLARIERIENGTAEMVGPFKTFEDYKAWVTSDEEDEI
ncbi:MAG: type II toxin-antitoxin system RelB/DinJ family antitoxin [Oscillospiraceae bacterium]|nr:type II toxin-antitoxin system RelB/DinJ family antitoxin [Oscillospiraceae bacterium]